jgi:hypothetical protein
MGLQLKGEMTGIDECRIVGNIAKAALRKGRRAGIVDCAGGRVVKSFNAVRDRIQKCTGISSASTTEVLLPVSVESAVNQAAVGRTPARTIIRVISGHHTIPEQAV